MRATLIVLLVLTLTQTASAFVTDFDLLDTNAGQTNTANVGTSYAVFGAAPANYRPIPFDMGLRPTAFASWRALFGWNVDNVTMGLQLYDFTNNQQLAELLCDTCTTGELGCPSPRCASSITPAACASVQCNSLGSCSVCNRGVVVTTPFNALVAAGGLRNIGIRTKGTGTTAMSLYGSRLEVNWTEPVSGQSNRVVSPLDLFGPQPAMYALVGNASASFAEVGTAVEALRQGPYRFSLGFTPAPRVIWRVVWTPNTGVAGGAVALYDTTLGTPIAEIVCSGGCAPGVACVVDAACSTSTRDVRLDLTSTWASLSAGAVDRSLGIRTRGTGSVAPMVYHASIDVVEDLGQ